MSRIKNSFYRGFSLIELMVVISIAGIILAVASTSYITAQRQSRNARRMEDLHNIQAVFEQYYSTESQYPTQAVVDRNSLFQRGVAPVDPKVDTPYTWNQATDEYCICATLESITGNADASSGTQCTWNSAGTSFCIQNQQ